jgi:maltoporin
VGIGRFQPLVRFQQAEAKNDGGTWRLIDAGLSYVVDEYAMRIALNYQNADIAGTKGNSLQLGVQIQK